MKTLRDYINLIEGTTEGIFDIFKKKDEPATAKYLPLTPEQRALIKRYFPRSNVDVRFGGADSKYVLPTNAHATYKNLRIAFRNEQGTLMASIGHYRNDSGPDDPNVSPVVHSDHSIRSAADMVKLQDLAN